MSITRALPLLLTMTALGGTAVTAATPLTYSRLEYPTAFNDTAAIAPGITTTAGDRTPRPVPGRPSSQSRLSGSSTALANCGITERVSVASDGTQADGAENPFWNAMNPVINADGRFVAFVAQATNLVPNDDNNMLDVFVYDRDTDTTERVSVASDGSEGNGQSVGAVISADGRFVAFQSAASNLVPADSNNLPDVFVHDRDTGITERVSLASDGGEANGQVWNSPAISADGRFIAFMSDADNLVPDDTNEQADIFVHDRDTGITERISVASDGSESNEAALNPGISEDGRFVTFVGLASNLVPDDTNGSPDVFVRDRENGTTQRVSVATDGSEGNDWSEGSGPAVISADGRFVTFVSAATNLVSNDTNGIPDVFVHDRETGATEWISEMSEVPDDFLGLAASTSPVISADGRYVLYLSSAFNLIADDTNNDWDAFLHDRTTGSTVRVSNASDCTEADGAPGFGVIFTADWRASTHVSISADGRHAAFYTMYPNLVLDDTNKAADIFVNTGVIDEAQLEFIPANIDFDTIKVGDTSPPQSAVLHNTGNSAAGGLSFSGLPDSGFEADTSDCGEILPAGESCEVVVTFTPAGTGVASATLEAGSTDGTAATLGVAGIGDDPKPPANLIFDDRFETNDD